MTTPQAPTRWPAGQRPYLLRHHYSDYDTEPPSPAGTVITLPDRIVVYYTGNPFDLDQEAVDRLAEPLRSARTIELVGPSEATRAAKRAISDSWAAANRTRPPTAHQAPATPRSPAAGNPPANAPPAGYAPDGERTPAKPDAPTTAAPPPSRNRHCGNSPKAPASSDNSPAATQTRPSASNWNSRSDCTGSSSRPWPDAGTGRYP
ncbi:hypothetical protein [Streptacidiphilus sp. PAMC 29251]